MTHVVNRDDRLSCHAGPPTTVRVDADFLGGNIVLERIEGDEVFLRQDLRDTEGWWFYWCFRVRGAAGRALTFRFTNENVIAARGPAVSLDDGASWTWLGMGTVEGESFCYEFPPEADEVRFCFATPYLEKNLSAFTARHAGNPHLASQTLCMTRKGRAVELLRVGRLDGACAQRVVLTCRHHACEMTANWVLEGILDTALGDDDDGAWLRRNVEMLVVPFVDKDGVEEGDQGKNRRPRDHNRDYDGGGIHPETTALRAFVPAWAQGRLRLALDLHCPWIRGGRNEEVHFVGIEDESQWSAVTEFSQMLETLGRGPIPYQAANNLPYGVEWNTSENWGAGKNCARWMFEQPGVVLAAGLEVPYANAGGVAVIPDTARALGGDIARALRVFLGG